MGFVTSDFDINQMQKADGWSDIVYGQRGNLSVWRANPGMIGSNLSVWRANPGMIGSNLSVWRAIEGLSNIATVAGKTEWSGNDLLLLDSGASATISPYGGTVYLMVSKEKQHRDANSCGETSKYGNWESYSSDTITVQSGRKTVVTQNERGYKGVVDKKTCSSNWLCQCWSDWKYRTRIQLASFIPDDYSGEDKKNGGPTPGPNPNPPPPPGLSPSVALPWVAGIGAIAIIGGVAFLVLKKRAPAVKGGV